MTELSYTAWDDNRYQWPPPEGWYQASDGKWWPEGYGPVADQATTEPAVETSESDEVTVGYETGSEYAPVVAEDSESSDDSTEPVADEFDAPEEAASYERANGTSEVAPVAEPEYDVDLDAVASGFTDSTETVHPAESRYEPESRYDSEPHVGSESRYDSDSRLSTSSAGMAASGFASRTEGGSSSLGLAGWAQTDPSDVRNRVDVSHEYDYSPPDGESADLLEPLEESDNDNDDDLDASPLDTSQTGAPAADGPVLDEPLFDDAALDTSAVDSPTLDTSAVGSPTLDTSAVGSPPIDSPPLDSPPIDAPAEPVDSTLSRLDDLKRQVEQQSFPATVASTDDVTDSDVDVAGFDPTETLDIDPNDLALESNPYYGGADETDSYGASSVADTDEPPAADTYDGDHVTADTGVGHDYDDRVESDSEGYGLASMGDAPAEAAAAAETRQYGYEGEAPTPVGDQPAPIGAEYGEPQPDYSSAPTLSPMSSPTPKPGPGRMVLYAVIGLLALAVAGVAGYLLFQLQGDDGDDVSGGDGATTTAVGGSDAGPSDLSGQGPGSFSNPHDLAGGVRLTVPLGDDGTEVWMLQVREPATTSDLGEGLVEVTSRMRVRNDSTSGDLTAAGLRFVLVSADGSTGTTAELSCSAGDDLDRQASIEPGKDIEGNVCWTVPASEATGALLGIESVHAGGRVHVDLS